MLYRLFLITFAVVALSLLCRFTYQRHAPEIESLVLRGAKTVLNAHEGHALTASADGRDVYLSGSVPATGALQRITRSLKAARGVRLVNTTAVTQGGTLESFNGNTTFNSMITADATGVSLTGEAPSRAARARAQALTGSTVELNVNPTGDDAWIDLVILVNRYRRQFDTITVEYTGTLATVRGTTSDSDAIRNFKIDLANVSTSRMNIVENLSLRGVGG